MQHNKVFEKRVARRSLPQTASFATVTLLFTASYWLMSGGNESENDRIIISQCWKTAQKQHVDENARQKLNTRCERMEHGFESTYGRAA